MKLVYIAGPYRSTWPWLFNWLGRLINIYRARRMAKRVWRDGFAAICPHMNSAMMDGICPDNNFLLGGKRMLKGCDVLLLLKGWEKSDGSRDEFQDALNLKMPFIEEESWSRWHPLVQNSMIR
jgi:hypothetical protein